MRRWIEDVLEEPVEWGAEDSDSPGSGFADGLMDGEILCKYDILQSANADEFKVVASLQLKITFLMERRNDRKYVVKRFSNL